MEPAFRNKLSFLSNMDETEFYLPSLALVVKSGEHGFQALKTLDREEQARVLAAATPQEAKREGRAVTMREDWLTYRNVAMWEVIDAKFDRGYLAWALVATEQELLVETNYWHDQYWGSCYCAKHEAVDGENVLGSLLVEKRIKLKRNFAANLAGSVSS